MFKPSACELIYCIVGNFEGRKLSQVGKFCGEKVSGVLVLLYTPTKFCGENFCGWLANCKICESFLLNGVSVLQCFVYY